jgi:hypothetical protein
MKARTIVTALGAGLLVVACGGSTPDGTAATSSDLSRLADGGLKGKACKPLDGGTSPCARGDGGDDESDQGDDEGDDGGDRGRDGAARGDGARGADDQGDDGGDRGDDSDDGGGRPDGAGRH